MPSGRDSFRRNRVAPMVNTIYYNRGSLWLSRNESPRAKKSLLVSTQTSTPLHIMA